MKHSQSQFKSSTLKRVPRTWYNQNHSYFTTQGFNEILPFHWAKLNPGDKFTHQTATVGLTESMFAPTFSRIQIKERTFAVPVRKLVPWFDKFVTSDPNEEWTEPYVTVGDFLGITNYNASQSHDWNSLPNSLAERMGLPCMEKALFRLVVNNSEYNTETGKFIYTFGPSHYFDLDDFTWNGPDELSSSPQDPRYKQYFVFDDTAYGVILTAMRNNLPRDTDEDLNAFLTSPINLLPFLAYQKVYFDWFKNNFEEDLFEALYDQLTHEVVDIPEFKMNFRITPGFYFAYNDGLNEMSALKFLFTIRNIGKDKDVFTTCSDGSQTGPDLTIGLMDKLDIYFKNTGNTLAAQQIVLAGSMSSTAIPSGDTAQVSGIAANGTSLGDVYAKINDADVITPTRLRWQMALQRFLERSNIGGNSRYTDFVFGHYGIRIPDPYLLRSVYVGGKTTDIKSSRIIATADGQVNDNASVLGDYAGTGEFGKFGTKLKGRVMEHCILISMVYIKPDDYYYQGLSRKFTNVKLLDSWVFPEFTNVGEEQVLKREVVFGENAKETFGYQRRYYDKTSALDEIHGDFTDTLRYWLTGRDYTNTPSLGAEFIRRGSLEGSQRIFTWSPAPFSGLSYRPIRMRIDIMYSQCLPLPSAISVGRVG